MICQNCSIDKPEKSFDPQPRKDGSIRFQRNCNTCRCKLTKYRKFGRDDLTVPSPYIFCEESWRDFKICSVCKVPKTYDAFAVHKGRAVSDCRTCRRQAQQKRLSEMSPEKRTKYLEHNRQKNLRNLTPEKVVRYYENRKTPEKRERERLKNRRYATIHPDRAATYRNNARKARKLRLAAMSPNEREDFLEHERAGRRMRRLIRRARESGCPAPSPVTKKAMIERYGQDCYLCGKHLKYSEVTIDHVIALAGPVKIHTLDNVRPACRPCNLSKGAKPLDKHIDDQTKRLFRIA